MLTRRRFVQSLAAALAWLTLPLREAFAGKKVAIQLAKAKQLKDVGGSVLLKIQGHKIMFIRDAEESVRAVDPTCTHKHCQVKYFHEHTQFRCKCHGSRYNVDGTVAKGPAPKALTAFPAKLSGKQVIVELP